jgi:thioredoxin-dependent peroxiredoxin
MSIPSVGKRVADFSLPATGGETVRLKDLRGAPVVLYFYPKDDTPGCTLESQDFRDQAPAFARLGAVVLGVSRDSVASHEKFKAKHTLPFRLLSDGDEALCQRFGVMKDKNMYGRKVRGIERSTFVIDAEGVLRREWRGVKVKGHVTEVLESLRAL